MSPLSVPDRIRSYNEDRNPRFLAYKYAAMRESKFRFFRGTCHLFNNDIPTDSFVWQAPLTWNVGDLHIENFGSFKADNRVAYFDLNDFDESILAPNLADLARVTCSLFVSASALQLNEAEVMQLVKTLTEAYALTLSRGYIRSLEQESARGIVGQFLRTVECRKRRAFLKSRLRYKKHTVRFRRRSPRTSPVDAETRQRIETAVRVWAQTQPDPAFFDVLDIAHRLAGTGSLGIDRYILIVRGYGKRGKEYLLDLKQAVPSSLQNRLTDAQPIWISEAQRIVEVQKRVQAASPALLHPISFPGGASYVLRELQPVEDRISLNELIGKPRKLLSLVATMGRLCGWGHLRASGRQGSAIADALISFGQDRSRWEQPLIEYAYAYAQQVGADYETYCDAYDQGFFHTVATDLVL
ncbi:DUF2252 domain-containing protein [Spirosoma rhododendri]|uniref:DUF2252 family protein n=1 Tax=Spirosoma rhododendri TaxID=2728024 RepID=A0A7L5E013_9BACT|nr:DUF2252 family protein [Spirosoma rhododendri]QJD81090.1 DUF2252 family protein [Spirosoma rhododendri]